MYVAHGSRRVSPWSLGPAIWRLVLKQSIMVESRRDTKAVLMVAEKQKDRQQGTRVLLFSPRDTPNDLIPLTRPHPHKCSPSPSGTIS